MKKLLVSLSVLTILSFSSCGKTERMLKEEGKVDYTTFSSDLYKDKSSNEKGKVDYTTFSSDLYKDKSSNEKGKVDYTTFLSDLYENKSSDEELDFSIKDLDNNGIPELVIAKDGVNNITVYTFNDTVVEVGNHNFETGTTRLLFSDNSSYPGLFSYFESGGLDHYGYVTIKDSKLMYEELWNEDYSGISEELGISRERIEEISTDKQLINESRKVYNENKDLPFQELQMSEK